MCVLSCWALLVRLCFELLLHGFLCNLLEFRKWRIIIAVNFQLKQLERRTWNNIRASTGFESVSAEVTVKFRRLLSSCLGWKCTGMTAEVTGSNPVEAPDFVRLLFSCLSWKFTAMIIPHFHLQPQNEYELFHIYFIPLPELRRWPCTAVVKKSLHYVIRQRTCS